MNDQVKTMGALLTEVQKLQKEYNELKALYEKDISHHNEVEEKLTISETNYRRLFETAKDGIILLDAKTGMITDVNPFLVELLGFTKEEFINKAIWEIGFFKDIAANYDKFLELQQKGYVRYDDLPLESIDGRKIRVEFVSNVYQVNHHDVIQCNIRDISNRKQMENALRESENKFRNLFNNSEVGMFRTRLDGSEILEFNERYLKILNYTHEEIKGNPSMNIWADHRERDEMVKMINTDGHVTDFECSILNKKGEVRRCITSLLLYRDTGILEGSIQDITERKKAEEALRVSEEKYRNLFENVQDVFYQIDLTGIIQDISPSIKHFSEFNRDELIGTNVFKLYYDNNDREIFFNALKKNNEVMDYELKFKTKNGVLKVASVNARLISNAEGKPHHIDGSLRDITERKKSEELLKESESSLNEAQKIGKIGNWELDLLTQKAKWSKNCFIIYGLEPYEIEPSFEYFKSRIHPDDLHIIDESFENILRFKESNNTEIRILFPDGSCKWFQNNMVPIMIENKLVALNGTQIDITE